MSDIEPTGRATVLVCITCRTAADFPQAGAVDSEVLEPPRPGLILAEATAVAASNASGISVQRVRCLANCGRGLSAAIPPENVVRWTAPRRGGRYRH